VALVVFGVPADDDGFKVDGPFFHKKVLRFGHRPTRRQTSYARCRTSNA
jgi:hypothetical protein